MKFTKDNFDLLLIVFVFFSFTCFSMGLSNVSLFINWHLFAIFLLIIGFIIGIIGYKFLKIIFSKKIDFNEPNLQSKIVVIFMFLTFGFGFNLHKIKSNNISKEKFFISDINNSKKSHNIYVYYKGEQIQLDFGKGYCDAHQIGDTIELTTKANILGFEYIEPSSWK